MPGSHDCFKPWTPLINPQGGHGGQGDARLCNSQMEFVFSWSGSLAIMAMPNVSAKQLQ